MKARTIQPSNSYTGLHPDAQALERYAVRCSSKAEEEVIDIHILCCDACLQRIEAMERDLGLVRIPPVQLPARSTQECDPEAARPANGQQKWPPRTQGRRFRAVNLPAYFRPGPRKSNCRTRFSGAKQ